MTLSPPVFLYSRLKKASCFPVRRRRSQEVFLRLPQARPYGLPPFCSQVFPRNLPAGFVW